MGTKIKINKYQDSIIPQNQKVLFSKTNYLWNKSNLNNYKFVGKIMNFVRKKQILNWEDFRDAYFESGKNRDLLLESYDYPTSFNYDDIYKKIDNSDIYDILSKYGRTEEYINDLIQKWKEILIENKYDIDDEFAKLSVYQRLFVETLKGEIMENEIMFILNKTFENFKFRKSSATIDNDYAVDIECYSHTSENGELKLGIQVKPCTYKTKLKDDMKDWQKEAIIVNKNKNQKYTEKFNTPVSYIKYATIDSENIEIQLDKLFIENITRTKELQKV